MRRLAARCSPRSSEERWIPHRRVGARGEHRGRPAEGRGWRVRIVRSSTPAVSQPLARLRKGPAVSLHLYYPDLHSLA